MIKNHLKTGKLKTLSYFLIFVSLLGLTACASRLPQYKGGLTKRDGAPREQVDVSRIPDAEPKIEPRSKYGNPKSYVVKGRRYHVLKSARGYNRVGHASWYGTRFHGRLMSSRERYNLYAMVAASPHLPIPTYVKVTNLENGRSVIVKVADRGPFRRGRILDLSFAAAKKLGYAHKGTAKVRVQAIDPVQWAKEKGHLTHRHFTFAHKQDNHSPLSLPKRFVRLQTKPVKIKTMPLNGKALVQLQVGVFSNRHNAEQLKMRLLNLIQRPIRVNRDTDSHLPLYRVQITSSREESSRLQALLQEQGLNPMVKGATG